MKENQILKHIILVMISLTYFSTLMMAQLGLHVAGNQSILFGEDTTQAGTNFFWSPTKGAIRAGLIGLTGWDYGYIGSGSSAFGVNNIASGGRSFAWGFNNLASGVISTTWGEQNVVSGPASTAWGVYNQVSGNNSTAWGSFNKASEDISTAWGLSNRALGRSSTVWGRDNYALSYLGTVLGRYADTLDHSNANSWEEDDYLFVAGNGTSISNRSNALTLYKSGDLTVGRKLSLDAYDSPWGVEIDDCVITTDLSLPNSDLILVANDAVAINLDDDDNSNSSFQVLNGDDQTIMQLDENGNLTIMGNLNQGSDRHRKENLRSIDSTAILKAVNQLAVYEWQYQDESIRHIGPMAQDFYHQLGYGQGDQSISAIDMDGVLLTAIKAQQKRIENLEKMLTAQQETITLLKTGRQF